MEIPALDLERESISFEPRQSCIMAVGVAGVGVGDRGKSFLVLFLQRNREVGCQQ